MKKRKFIFLSLIPIPKKMSTRRVNFQNQKRLIAMSYKDKENNCRLCFFLRVFLISVLFLIIVSFTLTDKLHLLAYINSWNAAIAILAVGILVFIGKIFQYFTKQKSSVSEKSDE